MNPNLEIELRGERSTNNRESLSSALSGFHTEATDTIEQGDKLASRFNTAGKRDAGCVEVDPILGRRYSRQYEGH